MDTETQRSKCSKKVGVENYQEQQQQNLKKKMFWKLPKEEKITQPEEMDPNLAICILTSNRNLAFGKGR